MIEIREVSENDLNSLSDFLSFQPPFSHTTKDMWMRRFNTWWVTNPANNSQFPMGWVLVEREKILGFLGNVPLKFLIYGEDKNAAAAVAWYVDPTARGIYSLRLLNEFLKQDNVSLFLFNTDSEELMRLLYKFGFKEYILPKFKKIYCLVLEKRKLLFLLKELSVIKRIHNFTSFVTMLISTQKFLKELLFQNFTNFLDSFQSEEYTSSLCSSCDDSYSNLWVVSNHQCDIKMMRNIGTLNWIYFSSINPSERIVIQCRRTRDDSLAGYAVFDILRQKPSDTAVMKLMDMCIEDYNFDALTSLLEVALNIAKKNRVPLLELWARDEKTEEFLKTHFPISKPAQHHNFIKFSDAVQQRSIPPVICPSIIDPPRGIDHF